MAVKKLNVIGILLLLALAVSSFSGLSAQDGNNLVQLDLKRSSNDSLNVTLYTSDNYNDNVLVRKKSDNKYVILIPKVQSSGYSIPALNGVKDLVSNIDVKNVTDTSGGYTKVTLITTKPLEIKTNTVKSAPLSKEQKEYKTLIAEANAVKNTINPAVNKKQQPSKTEITVNRAKTSDSTTVKLDAKPNEQANIPPKKTVETIQKPQIELEELSAEKLARQTRKEHLAELIHEVKQEQLDKQVPDVPPEKVNVTISTPEQIKDIKDMPKTISNNVALPSRQSLMSKFKHNFKILGIILGSILLLMSLKKLVKHSHDNNLTKPVNDNYAGINRESSDKYSNITNNKELSWQEKYQQYLDASAKPVSRGKNKGNYVFIKTPAEPDIITRKRTELEKLLEEMPSYQQDIQPEIVEVQSEDSAIQNSIKFKAFDNHRLSLNTTNRAKSKSRFKKYEVEIPLHEQKTVDLENSPLYTNPRSLKDANLDVKDVDRNRIKYKSSDYIMSTVDEYLSLLDSEKAAIDIEKPIVPVMRKTGNEVLSGQSNPISKAGNEFKSSYLNNLIIKSGFNIDANKGFYMVNLDGKSALIGRVNDEITVLKKYDKIVDKPLQVRHDNANVYMVKADGFKSLIEVNDDKMGVLIEL